MKIKREYKTAIIVLLAVLLAIWGFNYLKGKDILNSYQTYYAITDNVEGVVKSTPVSLKGIQIGSVKDFEFYNGIEKTILILSVQKDFHFSKDSKVKIYGGSIMGGKSVAITVGKDTEMAKDGDTLQVEKTPGMFDLVNDKITPLQDKLERILTSTDTLLLSVNKILDPATQQHISHSLADLEVTMKAFKNSSVRFDQILQKNQTHLDSSFENIDKLSTNFVQLSDSLKQIQLGKVVNNLNQTIAKINTSLDKINKGDGTMSKLMNDKSLYENLAKSTKELENLLKDLQANPKRYVHFSIWGRKDKKK